MIDGLLEQARATHRLSGLPVARFAELAGISPARLRGFHTPYWNPTSDTLRALLALSQGQAQVTHAASRMPMTEWSFGGLAQHYLRDEAYARKCSARQEELLLERHVLPHWSERATASITAADVLQVVDGLMAADTPSSANRTLSLLNQVFLYGIRRGVLRCNPCAGIQRPHAPKPLQRVLSSNELRWVWRDLADRVPSAVHRALCFQLVTAQRLSEVIGTASHEIDWVGANWQIPPQRTKSRTAHMVPLSSLAMRLVADEARQRGSLFPSRRTGSALLYKSVSSALSTACARGGLRFTSRDLRRTAATGIIRLGFSRTVVAKILGHADTRPIGAYDWHCYDPEKRQALDAWAEWLGKVVR